MMLFRRSSYLLLGLLLPALFAIAESLSKVLQTSDKAWPPRRVLSGNRPRKVRGDTSDRRLQATEDRAHSKSYYGTAPSKSYYGTAYSDDEKDKYPKEPKSTKESTKESSSGKGKGKGKGGKKSGKSKTKGSRKSKSYAHSPKSQTGSSYYKSSKPQSMKKSQKSSNIFSHDDNIVTEIVPVDCGSDENPFLTTFVASVQLQTPEIQIVSQRKHKSSSTKKERSEERHIDVDDSEEEGEERMESGDLLFDERLSPGEQRDLELTFRDVYNNLTFSGCDGFFRKVYSVSLTLVERDEGDEEYSVTLQNTYRMDGTDEVALRVANGTLTVQDGELRRRLTNNSTSTSSYTYYYNFSAPTKEGKSGPSTHVQMVSGGEDLPIYYVSLAATCRNCEVTDSLNFPLLTLPEEDDYVSVSRISNRQGGAVVTSTTVDSGEDTCTCPLPVEENEEEIARRRLQRRRLDEHDLYFPPPDAPTAEEFVNAMNVAIRELQEAEGKLLRVAGIVNLIEPDYFQGEDPNQLQPPTPAPTISAMPSVSSSPSQTPTISSAPTITPMPTTETEQPTFEGGLMPTSNGTMPPNTTAPTTPPLTRRPTRSPTPRPTRAPTSAPTSAASTWVVSVWVAVVPLLLVLT